MKSQTHLRLIAHSFCAILFASVFFYSCKKEESLDKTPNNAISGQTILGDKLENPFSVVNMQKAYNNIKNVSTARIKDVTIKPTHLYVRFLPKDYVQYDTLMSDTTLFFLDHPIDYEVTQAGDYYHDPSIPENLPTYQYTAVPVDYIAPEGIYYEIIEELYLPKKDPSLVSSAGKIASEYEQWAEELEYEALSITGNLPEELKKTNTGGKTQGLLPRKWRPAGRIEVWDNRLNRNIGMEFVRVEARRFFEVNTGITDANGNFSCNGEFRYEANYSIPWERADFDIRAGDLFQANFNGPKMKGNWNLQIEQNGMSWVYAHVFRGAARYHYGNIGGLRAPGLSSKLKYCVYDENSEDNINGQHWTNFDPTGIFPDIKIWRTVRNRNRDADEIFSTTIHETAHASHNKLLSSVQFVQVSDVIAESWAVAVQWHVTTMEYRERGIPNYCDPFYTTNSPNFRINYAYQNWNSSGWGNEYTSVFIDLADNFNQQGQILGTTTTGTPIIGAVNDNVSGYTLSGIESGFLRQVYGLSSLREQLKANKPAGGTDDQIDELINQF